MSPLVAEAIAVVCLVAVLGFAGVRPRGLPEGAGAVPAALLVVVVGALPWATAWQEVQRLGPTVAFLAAILMLAHLCREEGMFDAAGQLMARRSRSSRRCSGDPGRTSWCWWRWRTTPRASRPGRWPG